MGRERLLAVPLEALALLLLCIVAMKKLPTLFLALMLPLAAQASDAIKFLKSDGNAADLVSYLERVGVVAERDSLFVAFEQSDELLAGLAGYVELMEMRMAASLENILGSQVTDSGAGEAYRRRFVEVGDDLEGVIRIDLRPGPMIYAPRHPDADERGMLLLSNVNVRREFGEIWEARAGHGVATKALRHFEPSYVATEFAPVDESYANLVSVMPLIFGMDLDR